MVFHLSIFLFSIFQNYLKDDTSCYKKKLSKFSSQKIIFICDLGKKTKHRFWKSTKDIENRMLT